MTPRPRSTIVLVHFDAKRNGPPPVQPNAPDLVKYLFRLAELPADIVHDARARVDYLMRGDSVGAFAAENFHSFSLAGVAYELALDAKSARARPALSHGTISLKLSPGESPVTPAEFLKVGHRAMELLGVDKNRYVLAVHVDTNHVHLHFLYSRVTEGGVLRERSRKRLKFMCEEACSILAYEFGFDLEKRHLSRADAQGVHDLASEQYVRDAAFEESTAGAEQRTKARRKLAAKSEQIRDIAKLALVARHLSQGELETFRAHLAEEGISYRKRGSGAEFVDAHGQPFKASDVDPRFSPERIGLRGVASNVIAEQPNWITAKIERRRAVLEPVDDLIPDVDGEAEWTRFETRREIDDEGPEKTKELARISLDVRRSFRENRAGRPPKAPLPDHWPGDTRPMVALASTSRSTGRPQLPSETYRRTEQPSRTEYWRDEALVATVRYSMMTIYSKKPEDLQAALLAANRAWGPIEVFGNKKFQRQVVELAAQLDVPISNPNLRAALAKARQKLGKPPVLVVSPARSQHSNQVTTKKLPENRTDGTPLRLIQPERRALPPLAVAQNPSQRPSLPSTSQERIAAPPATVTGDLEAIAIQRLLSKVDQENRPVIREKRAPHYFSLTEPDLKQMDLARFLGHPDLQRGLKDIQTRQTLDLDELEKQIMLADCRVRAVTASADGKLSQSYEPVQLASAASNLFNRYQSHPRCLQMLERAWQEQEARDQVTATREAESTIAEPFKVRVQEVALPTEIVAVLGDVQPEPGAATAKDPQSILNARSQYHGTSLEEASRIPHDARLAPTIPPAQSTGLTSQGNAVPASDRLEGGDESVGSIEGRRPSDAGLHAGSEPTLSPMAQWDALGLDDVRTLHEIDDEKRPLREEGGRVVFAQPEGVTLAHRLFLAAYQRAARRRFDEQQCAATATSPPLQRGSDVGGTGASGLSASQSEMEGASHSEPKLNVLGEEAAQRKVDRSPAHHYAHQAAQRGLDR